MQAQIKTIKFYFNYLEKYLTNNNLHDKYCVSKDGNFDFIENKTKDIFFNGSMLNVKCGIDFFNSDPLYSFMTDKYYVQEYDKENNIEKPKEQIKEEQQRICDMAKHYILALENFYEDVQKYAKQEKFSLEFLDKKLPYVIIYWLSKKNTYLSHLNNYMEREKLYEKDYFFHELNKDLTKIDTIFAIELFIDLNLKNKYYIKNSIEEEIKKKNMKKSVVYDIIKTTKILSEKIVDPTPLIRENDFSEDRKRELSKISKEYFMFFDICELFNIKNFQGINDEDCLIVINEFLKEIRPVNIEKDYGDEIFTIRLDKALFFAQQNMRFILLKELNDSLEEKYVNFEYNEVGIYAWKQKVLNTIEIKISFKEENIENIKLYKETIKEFLDEYLELRVKDYLTVLNGDENELSLKQDIRENYLKKLINVNNKHTKQKMKI